MHLFLIRHGETVDNVAGLYAGSRDSPLTAHGVLQTSRLATHLAQMMRAPSSPSRKPMSLFSSDLQRAVKTAEAVRDAQADQVGIEVQQLRELREKDFGTGEGQKYGVTARERVPHEGAESPESLRRRADAFLQARLLPLLRDQSVETVVVVSHGIILGVLYKRLCDLIQRDAISAAPEAQQAGPIPGAMAAPAWSNTGYLELRLTWDGRAQAPSGWSATMHVCAVNCLDHLKGLRKTRGGIGSARFDEKQKTINSFFKVTQKKRKLSDAVES